MIELVDTNILVYRFDSRYPKKKKIAKELLRAGLDSNSLKLTHQNIIEFVSAVRRKLLAFAWDEARLAQEAENYMRAFNVIYTTQDVVREALRNMSYFKISWYDAHLLAYASLAEASVLYSEDFQHERYYGNVQVINPFVS